MKSQKLAWWWRVTQYQHICVVRGLLLELVQIINKRSNFGAGWPTRVRSMSSSCPIVSIASQYPVAWCSQFLYAPRLFVNFFVGITSLAGESTNSPETRKWMAALVFFSGPGLLPIVMEYLSWLICDASRRSWQRKDIFSAPLSSLLLPSASAAMQG